MRRLLLLGGGAASYTSQMLGLGPFAYYAHNETTGTSAIDAVSARNGTYTNATLSATAPAYGGCFSLAATGYVTLPASLGTALAAAGFGAEGSVGQFLRVGGYSVWQGATVRRSLILQADSSNRAVLLLDSSNTNVLQCQYTAGGTTKSVSLAQVPSLWAGWVHGLMTWNKPQDRMRFYVNGVQSGSDQTGLGTWVGTPSTAYIGAGNGVPSQPWSGAIDETIIWTRELTAAEALVVGGGIPRGLVVFEGDSRTVGTGATAATNYPTQLSGGQTRNWKCANVGGSSDTLATMATQVASQIAPLYSSSYTRNVVALWGGVNDNTDATTMFNRYQAEVTAVEAAGFRVVKCTEIDCQSAAHTDWHTTNYQALNVLIRAAYPAAEIADLGAQAELQDATNTTYFNADKTHLTATGYGVVAGIVAATLANF